MNSGKKVKKEASFLISIIPVLTIILFLGVSIVIYEADPHIPIIGGAIVACLIAVYGLGYTWQEIEAGIIKSIDSTMQAVIILAIIGMLIGSWIAGGIVPTLIYYGLQILSPTFFLFAAVILCSIVSLATGSSWTTAGTVGIALIGVAQGLGISVPLAAGAIISGAYFGDKMSPLSDTTNLAPAMAGSTLFDHIKHMGYTTAFSYAISLVLYLIIGFRYKGQELDMVAIDGILNAITEIYHISPLYMLVPLIVITLVALKVPAIPGLIIGVLLGGVCIFTQGGDLGSVINVLQNGTEAVTEHEIVKKLLTGGGMQSMMWTISLIMCAMTFGGILEVTGMMETIARKMLAAAKSTGSLILVTAVSCLFVNVLCADQYLAIALPGKMFKDAYRERGLAPRNLSRVLEDSGTVTGALIPWNTCGATMSGFLGVATIAYLPFAFFNLLSPIVTIVFGYLGLTIMKLEDDPSSPEYKGSKKMKKAKA